MNPCHLRGIQKIAGAALSVLLILSGAGCSDRGEGKPKIKKKQGIARKVDVENRVVSMIITDKTGKDLEISGTFRDDTVVVINGRTMAIQDIRPGDKVEVQGFREGEGMSQKLIATRVVVDRPEEADFKSTGKTGDGGSSKPGGAHAAPTTQPANG